MSDEEQAMNLTGEQKKALERGEPVGVTLDSVECVVLRRDLYDRLARLYDDSLWADDELRALAAKTFDDADSAGPIP
jgi:hypothetical protein